MTKRNWVSVFSIAFLGLGACAPKAAPGETPIDTLTPETSSPSATSIPINLISYTPSPIHSPSPTPLSPSATPTPTPLPCWNNGGRIEHGEVRTQLLPLPLSFRIYLPACYDEQIERHYPVIYLIHGQNFNDDQWDRLGADETADALISSEELPPFIIVMPRDRAWTQPTEDKFGEALIQVLLPWIDHNYRTLPDRQHRSIGGLSRGAGWAIHLGLSYWESFGAIGAHSLPVFWTDLPHINGWLDSIPRDSLPRIYMDIGEKDRTQIMKSATWFESLLSERGIPHVWHLFPGYHEEAYWQAHIEEYLRWYAADW